MLNQNQNLESLTTDIDQKISGVRQRERDGQTHHDTVNR